MAARFIGLTVRVTLNEPKGQIIRGTVKEVRAGSELVVSNGQSFSLTNDSNQKPFIAELIRAAQALRPTSSPPSDEDTIIPVHLIEDLSIEEEETQKGRAGGTIHDHSIPVPPVAKPPQQQPAPKAQTPLKPAVIDPAIVSYQKHPRSVPAQTATEEPRGGRDITNGQNQPPPIQPNGSAKPKMNALTTFGHLFPASVPRGPASNGGIQKQKQQPVVDPPGVQKQQKPISTNKPTAPLSATLTEPFSQIELDASLTSKEPLPMPARREFLEPKKPPRRVVARNRKALNAPPGPSQATHQSSGQITHHSAYRNSDSQRTPRSKRNDGHSYADDPNGWATGEATDIQEAGDFDFASNLSKFDKRAVFNEIRAGDTTADEDRLHTFNRKLPTPRAGTAGGKNLHYTENVLDIQSPVVSHSSADDEARLRGGGRRGSERSVKRAAKRGHSRPVSRINTGSEAQRTGSSSMPDIHEAIPMSRAASALSQTMRTPKLQSRQNSNHFPNTNQRGFVYKGTNYAVPVLSPLQMLELEQLAISEYGINEDILTENAARSIADACTIFATTSHSTSLSDTSIPAFNIVILAGNTKSGSRAIASARHLRNRSLKPLLCLMGLDREDSLLESVRRQLQIFRHSEGRVVSPSQLPRTFARAAGKGPTIVLDALCGIHRSYGDLSEVDAVEFQALCAWLSGEAVAPKVLSLDVPSGMADGTEGSYMEGEVVRSDGVLCLGVPNSGTVKVAARAAEGEQMAEEVQARRSTVTMVGDIGIPSAVWKRFAGQGGKRGKGMEFTGRGVVEVELAGA